MKIGDLARASNVGVDTIRFYERRGILKEPARKPSGYRDYASGSVERIRFTKELQRMGFTLDEVALVLEDVDRGEASCDSEKHRFERVLARIDQRLADLRAIRRRLARTLDRCAAGRCDLVGA